MSYNQDVDPINITNHDPYTCLDSTSENCPYTCQGLTECESCGCAVVDDGTGPWGRAMDVIFCLLSIIFLVVVMIPPFGFKPMPTTKALPLSAFLMFLVRLMYLGSDLLLVCGIIVKGVHEKLTPLTIMAGAICLFKTMEATRCMPYIMREMKALIGRHGIAKKCIIYCFAMMVEGASGFGTCK